MNDAVQDALSAGQALSQPPALTYARRMSVPPDDSALMLRYRDGDVAAFESLYTRHNDALFRYVLRLSGNKDQAADIFQEVWSKIIKARKNYRPTAKFTTWMYRIAHNSFIDSIRRNKRYSDGAAHDPDTRPSETADIETQVENALARERLLLALRDLPVEQRDTFLLREEGGLSLEQIAHVTGVAPETAKSRLRYAMSKLKTAMSESTTADELADRNNELVREHE